MEDRTEKVNILRLNEDGTSEIEDTVVREFPLTIILNDQELVTMLCSPANRKELVVGFLKDEADPLPDLCHRLPADLQITDNHHTLFTPEDSVQVKQESRFAYAWFASDKG